MAKRKKKPWPTKEAMTQIYDMSLWGGSDLDFYSGFGSHNEHIIKPYLKAVTDFLKTFDKPITICDLGCGDFNIGKHLVSYTEHYIAIDIVESLIERNKTLFEAINLEFHCLDISKDTLPKADCIILRQVLQHISNEEIQHIVSKIQNYKYVILTEHIPFREYTPNKDVIPGQGIRLKKHSGVNLLQEPFNLKIKEEKQLSEFIIDDQHGKIVTILYTLF